MTHFLLAHEASVRLAVFGAMLVAMAIWEALVPRRALIVSRAIRWPNNLGIVVLNTTVLRLAFPAAAVATALMAEHRSWGLLNNVVMPGGARIVVAAIALDLTIYVQHVMFHAVPVLWRLHRVHHADIDFDVTTGLRFHPVEILLSMIIKLAAVVALGAPAAGVLVFEVLLNATAMFNHGNVGLPGRTDRMVRWLVVTPDMHRVHHSVIPSETNSNFGFNLSWWDRAFGTYRDQPSAGHNGMTIGLDVFRDPAQLRIDRMLLQPFVAPSGPYPMITEDSRSVTSPTTTSEPGASAKR